MTENDRTTVSLSSDLVEPPTTWEGRRMWLTPASPAQKSERE